MTNAGGKKQSSSVGLFAKATHRYTIGMVACNPTPSTAAAPLVWNRRCGGWRTQAKARFRVDYFPDVLPVGQTGLASNSSNGRVRCLNYSSIIHPTFMMSASKNKRFKSLFDSADVNMHNVLCYTDKERIMCP